MRTVKTASGATAVQIVHSNRRGSRKIEHIGSAHTADELAALKKVAADRLAAGQEELDLGLVAASGPLPITSSHMKVLWDTLHAVYTDLGFGAAAKGDNVFRDLVLARIIEPTSKLDSLRVLEEVGVESMSYRTLTRRLPGYASVEFRAGLSAACAARAPQVTPIQIRSDMRLSPKTPVSFRCSRSSTSITACASVGPR